MDRVASRGVRAAIEEWLGRSSECETAEEHRHMKELISSSDCFESRKKRRQKMRDDAAAGDMVLQELLQIEAEARHRILEEPRSIACLPARRQ